MAQDLFRAGASVAHGIARAYRNWRDRTTAERELMELDPADRARTLADLGLSSVDLAGLYAYVDRLDTQFSHAMAALGVDLRELRRARPDVLRAMQGTCLSCPSGKECRRALRLQPGDVAAFCPNARDAASLAGRRSFAA